jgi:quercetin dioxygenase-like cupin family protein
MLTTADSGTFRQVLQGVRLKTLAHGERTLMTVFQLDAGAVVPVHRHPQEQIGYLVSGRLRFLDGAGQAVAEVGPGDSWCFGADEEHGAEILEDAVAIEVFSPVRQDYLDLA